MGKHSNFGPVDPQLNGIPAAGVIEEFKKALVEIRADPDKAILWREIIRQYPPSFLGQREKAVLMPFYGARRVREKYACTPHR
jgi:hypothetical protein